MRLYPTCLLLHFNTLHEMLTPLLNIITLMDSLALLDRFFAFLFVVASQIKMEKSGLATPDYLMECQHLCFKQEDQSVRMNEQRTNDGAR